MEISKKKYVCLPPLKTNPVECYYPYEAYVSLICEIPYGKLATIDALIACLEKAFNVKGVSLERPISMIEDKSRGVYPHWRVVSERGHLLNSAGKTSQRILLEEEGHIVEQPNPEKDAYVVKNYKSKLFDFESLFVTVACDPKKLKKEYEEYCAKRHSGE